MNYINLIYEKTDSVRQSICYYILNKFCYTSISILADKNYSKYILQGLSSIMNKKKKSRLIWAIK